MPCFDHLHTYLFLTHCGDFLPWTWKKSFWTTQPPHLVHVVIERLLKPRTVDRVPSKFASLLFDQRFQTVISPINYNCDAKNWECFRSFPKKINCKQHQSSCLFKKDEPLDITSLNKMIRYLRETKWVMGKTYLLRKHMARYIYYVVLHRTHSM